MLESTGEQTDMRQLYAAEPNTTTKFKGDIIFNNGEKDVKASELAMKSELPALINELIR